MKQPSAWCGAPTGDEEKSASSASSSISASTADEGITDGQHAAFLPVPVVPWFCPEQHAAVFQRLQTPPKAKLLDLTPLQELDMGVFDSLAAAWTAPGTAAPRLGILLPFERWVMLRSRALAALQPLADRGIRLEVFYITNPPSLRGPQRFLDAIAMLPIC